MAGIYEAMRLLPPSWNILRYASAEYPAADPRITPGDGVLLLPLLSHRNPKLSEDPSEFRPERWDTLDPDTTSPSCCAAPSGGALFPTASTRTSSRTSGPGPSSTGGS